MLCGSVSHRLFLNYLNFFDSLLLLFSFGFYVRFVFLSLFVWIIFLILCRRVLWFVFFVLAVLLKDMVSCNSDVMGSISFISCARFSIFGTELLTLATMIWFCIFSRLVFYLLCNKVLLPVVDLHVYWAWSVLSSVAVYNCYFNDEMCWCFCVSVCMAFKVPLVLLLRSCLCVWRLNLCLVYLFLSIWKCYLNFLVKRVCLGDFLLLIIVISGCFPFMGVIFSKIRTATSHSLSINRSLRNP